MLILSSTFKVTLPGQGRCYKDISRQDCFFLSLDYLAILFAIIKPYGY